MIKAIYFIKRKPGMDVEAFQHYWKTTHADIVKKVPHLRRYAQSHTLLSGYRKRQPIYDGIAELWFDDVEAMRRIADSPESNAAQADDYNFISMPMDFVLTREVVQKDGPTNPSMVKLIEFVHRKPGMEVEKFQAYWREVHGPLASGIPVMRRYIQSHLLPSAYRDGRQPVCDGIAEVWFDSTADMRVSEKTSQYAATRADEPNFIAPGNLDFIITKEHVIVD